MGLHISTHHPQNNVKFESLNQTVITILKIKLIVL